MKLTKFTKCLIVVCIVLLNISTATSQIQFGLKAGIDVAENKISKKILKANNRIGFQVGPTANFSLPLVGLGVDASLLYGFKDYEIKSTGGSQISGDMSDYHYLMVPVHLKKSFSFLSTFGVFVKGGPYAEMKLSGGEIKAYGEKLKSKSFGVGLNFGVGVQLFSKFEVGMDYRFKLTDNYKDNKPEWKDLDFKKDKTWNVNATYLF